jgi:phosphate uptake regulator
MEPSDDIPEDTGDVDQQNQAGSEDEDVLSQPSQTLQHRPKDHAEEAAEEDDVGSEENDSEQSVVIEIMVPAPERPEEYEIVAESTIVSHVVEELERPGDEIWYNIVFEDGREEEVSEFPEVLVRFF